MTKTEIKKAIHDAVFAAIREMGLNEFKKTSFFMSNDRAVEAFDINELEETLGALRGKHNEGWINITMKERRLFAKLLEHQIAAIEALASPHTEAEQERGSDRWFLSQAWTARQRSDGQWEPGEKVSGTGISKGPTSKRPGALEMQRFWLENFGRIEHDAPYFYVDAPFVFVPTPEVVSHG